MKIGNQTIYPNQIKTANKIIHSLMNADYPPCLIAEPQEGKTGVAIYLANWALEDCKVNNKKPYIFVLCNISDNLLLEQTLERFHDANLVGRSLIREEHFQHRANYSKLYQKIEEARNDTNATIYLFIDECHEALNKEKDDNSGALFSKLTQALGITYGQPKSTWENKNVHIISISATQFTQAANANFEFISLEKDLENPYFGIKQMFDSGRIFETSEILQNKNTQLTEFIKNTIQQYCDIVESNPGHAVIRITNSRKRRDNAMKFLEETFRKEFDRLKIKCEAYNCSEKNIKNIDRDLSNFNGTDKTIFFISGSMKAGKTLTNSKYIKMWIDNSSEYASTTIQSLGRLCGRKKEMDDCKYFGYTKFLKDYQAFIENPEKYFLESRFNQKSSKNNIIKYKVDVIKNANNIKYKSIIPEGKTYWCPKEIKLQTILKVIQTGSFITESISSNSKNWLGGGSMRGKDYLILDNYPKILDKDFEDIVTSDYFKNTNLEITKQLWEETKKSLIFKLENFYKEHDAIYGQDLLMISQDHIAETLQSSNVKDTAMKSLQDKTEENKYEENLLNNQIFEEKVNIEINSKKKNFFSTIFSRFNNLRV